MKLLESTRLVEKAEYLNPNRSDVKQIHLGDGGCMTSRTNVCGNKLKRVFAEVAFSLTKNMRREARESFVAENRLMVKVF